MTLFDVVFSGNDTVYGLTEGAIDAAIENMVQTKQLLSRIRLTACHVIMQ